MPQPITAQPQAQHASMHPYHLLEKAPAHAHSQGCDQCSQTPEGHRRCHSSRLRRLLLPFFITLVLIVGLLAASCLAHSFFSFDSFGWGTVGEGLARRATDAATDNGNDPFVHRKLYLIVIFVGLFVVVILAIMLSAWCCRGAFENPLCCPCYLCACCGGLACLECIGCGLCAEGIDQM